MVLYYIIIYANVFRNLFFFIVTFVNLKFPPHDKTNTAKAAVNIDLENNPVLFVHFRHATLLVRSTIRNDC